MEYSLILKQAEDLRKQKKFADALPLYQTLWTQYRTQANEWTGWAYAQCLKNEKLYADALNVTRDVYKLYPNFELNNRLYAWCIYYTEIAVEKPDKNNLLKAVVGITKLSKQDDKYAPYTIAVMKTTGFFLTPFDHQNIIVLTNLLDPNLLDNNPFQFTDVRGKEFELAGNLEKYYQIRTKALLRAGRYEDCINLCETAMNQLQKFHYDNDIWFRFKMANAYQHTQQYDKAEQLLLQVVERKQDWFVYHQLAELMVAANSDIQQDAIRYICNALKDRRDTNLKLPAYELFMNICLKLNLNFQAILTWKLIIAIRNENKWKISEQFLEFGDTFGAGDTQYIMDLSLPEMLKKWNNEAYFVLRNRLIKFKGTILFVDVVKKFGALIDNDNKKHNFRLPKNANYLPQKGDKVEYILQKYWDYKYNKVSHTAVNIGKV